MIIYLIRHGESQANANKIYAGHTDFDLSKKGVLQAKATANYLKDIKVDKIYSSDLIRAYNTALATASLKNMPIEKDVGLRELYVGKLEGLTRQDLIENHSDFMQTWRTDIKNTTTDGGESVKELYDRFVKTVTKIADNNQGKTLFIFSHATAIRAFVAYCMGGIENMNDLGWADNASVTKVSYTDGKFNLIEYGKNDFMPKELSKEVYI